MWKVYYDFERTPDRKTFCTSFVYFNRQATFEMLFCQSFKHLKSSILYISLRLGQRIGLNLILKQIDRK